MRIICVLHTGHSSLVEETRASNTFSNCALYEWQERMPCRKYGIFFPCVHMFRRNTWELLVLTFVQNLEYFTVDATLSHAFFLSEKMMEIQKIECNSRHEWHCFSVVLTRHVWLMWNAKSGLLLNCCLQDPWWARLFLIADSICCFLEDHPEFLIAFILNLVVGGGCIWICDVCKWNKTSCCYLLEPGTVTCVQAEKSNTVHITSRG